MIIYKSKTGRTVTVEGGYMITVDPGLQFDAPVDAIEKLIPELVEKVEIGVAVVGTATEETKSPVAEPVASTGKTEEVKPK